MGLRVRAIVEAMIGPPVSTPTMPTTSNHENWNSFADQQSGDDYDQGCERDPGHLGQDTVTWADIDRRLIRHATALMIGSPNNIYEGSVHFL